MRFLGLFLPFLLLSLLSVSGVQSDVHVSVSVDVPSHHRRHLRPHHFPVHSQTHDDEADAMSLLNLFRRDPAPVPTPSDPNVPLVATKNGKPVNAGPFRRVVVDGKAYLRPLTPSTDPWGPDLYMPTGPKQGQYVDTSSIRSLAAVTPQQMAQYHLTLPNVGPHDKVVANFYHEGKYWIAHIPADCVDKMIVQAEIFAVIMGHAQVRWILHDGKEITLYGQPGTPSASLPPLKIKDLITSNEAAFTVDPLTLVEDSYDAIGGGRQDHYLFANRVMSTATRKAEIQEVRTEQYHITTSSPTLVNKFFKRAIEYSIEVGMKNVAYNTLDNSCSTSLYVDTIDWTIRNWATEAETRLLQPKGWLLKRTLDLLFKKLPLDPFFAPNMLNGWGLHFDQIKRFAEDIVHPPVHA